MTHTPCSRCGGWGRECLCDRMTQPHQIDREAVTHEVKCWPAPFAAVRSGAKPWELRLNDRDYRVGDTLRQFEWCPDKAAHTGEVEEHRIGWALYGPAFGLPDGYVIMTLDHIVEPTDMVRAPAPMEAVAWRSRVEAAFAPLRSEDDERYGNVVNGTLDEAAEVILQVFSTQVAAPTDRELTAICQRMADDHQTSEGHHPRHVLVLKADFDAMTEALSRAPAPLEAVKYITPGGKVINPVLAGPGDTPLYAAFPAMEAVAWRSRSDAWEPSAPWAIWSAYPAHLVGLKGFTVQALALIATHPVQAPEAVAWRVKDYADGWILFHHEAPARKSGEARNGALVEPLYTHPVQGGEG